MEVALTPPSTGALRAETPSTWWRWLVRPTELIAILAIIASLLAVIGVRFQSPGASIAALDSRVTHVERRQDTLSDKLSFTNYLQCVQMRMDHPVILPSDCAPVERAWRERKAP